jgi:hypothetical protein
MKRFATLLLFCLALSTQGATQYYRVKATFTGNPANGNTVTINGTVKTFVTAVTTVSTQILIGADETETAENWHAHNQSYPYTRILSSQSGTIVDLLGEIGFTVTASMTGTWGTVVVAPQTVTQFPLVLPLSGESSTTRETRANALVDAFDYATDPFVASVAALTNFVNVPNSQTVTGPKFFTGATILSNLLQVIYGGFISNAIARDMIEISVTNLYVKGPFTAFNTAPAVYWTDTDGPVDEKVTKMNFDGSTFSLSFMNDALNSSSAVLTVTRAGTVPQVIAFPLGTVAITNLLSLNFQGIATNASLYAVTNAVITNLYPQGIVKQTNSNPGFWLYDSNGAANEKRVAISGSSGALTITLESDDQSSFVTPFQIARSGTAAALVYLGGPSATHTEVEGPFWNYGNSIISGNVSASGIIAAGTTNATAPTGMSSGFLSTNATAEPSADPSNASVLYSYNNEWKARENGSGLNWRVKNAGAQTQGAGTDYTLTGSYAQVTFGSGGNTISLPTGGTYLVTALVEVIEDGANANDSIAVKLFNATASADITSSERQIGYLPVNARGQVVLSNVITVSTATTLHLYAKNLSGARGTIDSEQTSLSYVRLY